MSQPEHPWVLLISVNRNTSQAWPGKFMLQGDVDSFEKLPRPKLPAQAVVRVRELTRENTGEGLGRADSWPWGQVQKQTVSYHISDPLSK